MKILKGVGVLWLEFISTTTSTALVGFSLAHLVECWIINLEVPGSIPTCGELFISTFHLFPFTQAKKEI